MSNYYFPEENPDEHRMDQSFLMSDYMQERFEYLASLFDQSQDIPMDMPLVEPTPQELAVMDANAELFLESLDDEDEENKP